MKNINLIKLESSEDINTQNIISKIDGVDTKYQEKITELNNAITHVWISDPLPVSLCSPINLTHNLNLSNNQIVKAKAELFGICKEDILMGNNIIFKKGEVINNVSQNIGVVNSWGETFPSPYIINKNTLKSYYGNNITIGVDYKTRYQISNNNEALKWEFYFRIFY